MRKEVWYEKLFVNIGEIDSHTKVICTAFKCLQFGFVIFWQKDFGTKAAHKMLVKLTPGWSTFWVLPLGFTFKHYTKYKGLRVANTPAYYKHS